MALIGKARGQSGLWQAKRAERQMELGLAEPLAHDVGMNESCPSSYESVAYTGLVESAVTDCSIFIAALSLSLQPLL